MIKRIIVNYEDGTKEEITGKTIEETNFRLERDKISFQEFYKMGIKRLTEIKNENTN